MLHASDSVGGDCVNWSEGRHGDQVLSKNRAFGNRVMSYALALVRYRCATFLHRSAQVLRQALHGVGAL